MWKISCPKQVTKQNLSTKLNKNNGLSGKLTQIVASHTAVVVVVDNIVAEYVMVESGMGLVSAVRRGVGLSLDRGRAGDAGPKVGTARRRHSHSLPPSLL